MAPGSFYSSEKKLPPAVSHNIKRNTDFDKTDSQQYGILMGNIIRGDFGDFEIRRAIGQRMLAVFSVFATTEFSPIMLRRADGGHVAALKQNSASITARRRWRCSDFPCRISFSVRFCLLIFSLYCSGCRLAARWGGASSLILPSSL